VITEGLDGLGERLAEYRASCAVRQMASVIDIGADFPTEHAIRANAAGLARYAACAEQADIVPSSSRRS